MRGKGFKSKGMNPSIWTNLLLLALFAFGSAFANTLDGESITRVVIDPADSATLYAATMSSGIFKSTDGGQTWSEINAGLSERRVLALAIDPQNSSVLYAGTAVAGRGTGHIYKTTNGGEHWFESDSGHGSRNVSDIAIDRQNPDTLYAGSSVNAFMFSRTVLFKSTDGGVSWRPVLEGYRSTAPWSIVAKTCLAPEC